MIKNYMEDIIDHILPDLIKEHKDICTCDRCIEDIKAVALNKLPPLYIVTEKGLVYTKLNELKSQFKINVITELALAIEIVSQNPNH
ncbi:late competence development ComFB family protein [Clostridium oceanicum]|uniref:Late competence development ComFB family protein n=1 Tax=Clostridium oceanicum TaxID=1543 RepID=A0ABN1JHF4_9CLOT